jgi:hypothetical protein
MSYDTNYTIRKYLDPAKIQSRLIEFTTIIGTCRRLEPNILNNSNDTRTFLFHLFLEKVLFDKDKGWLET